MVYGGIDFALNSTGICIYDDVECQYTYINLTRKIVQKHEEIIQYIGIEQILNRYAKIDRTSELTKLVDAMETTDTIIDLIDSCDYIGIEGASFGSKGNSIAEISGYHYLIREKLYKMGIPFEVYPPRQIKKFAGNGKWGKEEMFDQFQLEDVQLAKDIIEHEVDLIKPLDDIIDAYYIVKKLRSEKK